MCAHDAVAQKDYFPRLPEIPLDVEEDEDTIKIVQLVKSNEPLVNDLYFISNHRWNREMKNSMCFVPMCSIVHLYWTISHVCIYDTLLSVAGPAKESRHCLVGNVGFLKNRSGSKIFNNFVIHQKYVGSHYIFFGWTRR